MLQSISFACNKLNSNWVEMTLKYQNPYPLLSLGNNGWPCDPMYHTTKIGFLAIQVRLIQPYSAKNYLSNLISVYVVSARLFTETFLYRPQS
jgi:hypothetical protein